MNSANIRTPYNLTTVPSQYPHNILNNIDAINDFHNISYDPKELIELVDCLKASGLLDDVPLPEKVLLDDFCDDLKLPASERRFSNYAARRMSDFITRRFSLLPHQTKSNTATRLNRAEDGVGSRNKAQGRQDMDGNQTGMKNVSTTSSSSNIQGSPEMQSFPFSSSAGQRMESMPSHFASQTSNMYPTVNDINMNAEVYLAIQDRLNRLKQEELQLNLLLQTTPNPFQTDPFMHEGSMNLLGLNQGLDLESQRQLRRLSLLAVAEAIGLPPQDIVNLHMNRRDSFYPFLSADLNPNFDYARHVQSGGMNPSNSLQDFYNGDTNYQSYSHHQRDSSDDVTSSILDEVDTDALVSTQPDDPQEQRRGSLDLLGTVAAAASENNNNNNVSHATTSRGSSMESAKQQMMGSHFNSSQQVETDSPMRIFGNFDASSFKKRQFDDLCTRDGLENGEDIKRTHLNSMAQVPRVNNKEMHQAMENLKQAMLKSQTSQRNIQKWDKQFGLKRSHSMTMTKTTKSRNQIRLMLDQIRTILPTSDSA